MTVVRLQKKKDDATNIIAQEGDWSARETIGDGMRVKGGEKGRAPGTSIFTIVSRKKCD